MYLKPRLNALRHKLMKTEIKILNKIKKRRNNEESLIQQAIVRHAELYTIQIADGLRIKIRDYLFAIPNGGSRNIAEAVKLKKEGATAGISDLFFAFPAKGFHGLWMEIKKPGGKLTKSQRDWLVKMMQIGYAGCVARSSEEAETYFKNYLKGLFVNEIKLLK